LRITANVESVTMMRNREETTADVVAFPTDSAPPLTSKPLWQPIPAIKTAKTIDYTVPETISKVSKELAVWRR